MVGAVQGVASSPFTTKVSQLIDIIVEGRCIAIVNELIFLCLTQDRFKEGEWQADLVGHFMPTAFASREQKLEDQCFHFTVCEAGFLEA